MSDPGNLLSCIVDSDGEASQRRRQLRRRALAASAFLELAAVAILLVWPLITLTAFPPQSDARPVPLFSRVPSIEQVHPQHAPRFGQKRATVADIFRQPSRIPVRVYRTADADHTAPELMDDPAMRGEPGLESTRTGDADARPIAPQPPPDRPRMISRVMDGFLIYRVQPEYPAPAKMIRLAGTVELRAVIGTDGRIRQLALVSGNPILAQAAIAAVRQWIYQPTRLNGEPVEVETRITVNFILE